MESAEAEIQEVIDFRSDTFTQPTKEMRIAMMEAVVGDDVFAEDPTVNLLQKKVAEVLGKESALFVPSGTMGNLICVMTHCSRRGDEVLVGDKSHITIYEQGGVANLGGVHARTVSNLPDGTLDLDEVRAKIFDEDVHHHHPRSTLLCVENSHNLAGGRVLSLDYMDQVAELVQEHGLKLHVDGARLFNAAVALGVPAADLVVHADSVSICLSKGLGAPIGSVIAGSVSFITQARHIRKALGGGMRQAGVLAAPGLLALQTMSKRLHVDHENAKHLSVGLAAMAGIRVEPANVQTNIVLIYTDHPDLTSDKLVERLATPGTGGIVVKMFTVGRTCVRAVLHHHITTQQIDTALAKFQDILQNLTN